MKNLAACIFLVPQYLIHFNVLHHFYFLVYYITLWRFSSLKLEKIILLLEST